MTDGPTPADNAEDSFVGRRQGHLFIDIRAGIDTTDGRGGLELRIDPRHKVRVEAAEGQVRALAQIGPVSTVLGPIPYPADAFLWLTVEPVARTHFQHGFGPDDIVTYVAGPGGRTDLGRMDGRYLSTEVAGGMTGGMVGLFCSVGLLRVNSFDYRGSDEPLR